MRSPAVFVANRRLASAHLLTRWRAWPRRYWVQGAVGLIFIVGDLALEVTTRAYAAYLLPSVGLTLATFAVLDFKGSGLVESRPPPGEQSLGSWPSRRVV